MHREAWSVSSHELKCYSSCFAEIPKSNCFPWTDSDSPSCWRGCIGKKHEIVGNYNYLKMRFDLCQVCGQPENEMSYNVRGCAKYGHGTICRFAAHHGRIWVRSSAIHDYSNKALRRTAHPLLAECSFFPAFQGARSFSFRGPIETFGRNLEFLE